MHRRHYAVIGAGGGGQAIAGFLALRKHRVSLYNRSSDRISALEEAGGVWLEGQVNGFGSIPIVSTDIERVIEGAEVVMVAVPANAHRDVALLTAPYLRDGQMILLNPGRTGGALEFAEVLRTQGCRADVTVAEAQTFIFASRVVGPARTRIYGFKHVVPIAALPASRTLRVWEAVRSPFPQFIPARNVLETSLENIGAVFHPAPTVLNSGRIEDTGGDFDYYHDGVTPGVARIMEAIDHERLEVARALGVEVKSARNWLKAAYGSAGRTLYEAIHNADGYRGIRAPRDLRHRYIFEDVPASLVPLASLGDHLRVPTDTMKSIIHLASTLYGVDFWGLGRTVEKLGLSELGVDEILDLVSGGEPAEMVG